MTNEEFKELWRNDQLQVVHEDIDDGWRHGTNHITVFEQYSVEGKPLGIFWEAGYQVSGDKEYHGIRENDFEFGEVFKHTRTVVETYYTGTKDDAVNATP